MALLCRPGRWPITRRGAWGVGRLGYRQQIGREEEYASLTMLLTLTKRANQWLGTFLLKQGIKVRFALSNGVTILDNAPRLDSLLLLPLAMRLISLEAQEEGIDVASKIWQEKHTGSSTEKRGELDVESLGQKRIQVLERYLRPALLPNEQWGDVIRWRFHHTLIKWLRREFLTAKYQDRLRACFMAYPTLRESSQLAARIASSPITEFLSWKRFLVGHSNGTDNINVTIKERLKLPRSSLVKDAFDMQSWTRRKSTSATTRTLGRIAKRLGGRIVPLFNGALTVSELPEDSDLSQVSLQQILHLAGAYVSDCGAFNALCEQTDIYQLWTREYIDALGGYLAKRNAAFPGETVVLEVGAGDGSLSAGLAEFFDNYKADSLKLTNVTDIHTTEKQPLVVATDDNSWRIPSMGLVRCMDVQEAVAAFPATERWQVIVLCSWMPMNEDWSWIFRKHNVDEYILIGECDDGQCGDDWKTWGNDRILRYQDQSSDSADATIGPFPLPKPYEADGYTRRDMGAFSAFQFSRFDTQLSKAGRTVSFRKVRASSR